VLCASASASQPPSVALAAVPAAPPGASARDGGEPGGGAGVGEALLHFRFRGCTRFLRVRVDPAELAAARERDTSNVFSSVAPVRDARISRLVREQSRAPAVTAMAEELRTLRRRLELDADEYVELIASAVQALPYGGADPRVRLPVEVIAEGYGVCDDRSLLLSALLLHEGYDVGVWAFDYQAHAAVAVRCSGPGYRGSGYAIIETNRPAFVGQMGAEFRAATPWRRTPQLVRAGGRRAYEADLESAFLARVLERSRSTVRRLEPYTRRPSVAPPRWRGTYAAAARTHDDAARLVALIETSRDERSRLYRLLTDNGGR